MFFADFQTLATVVFAHFQSFSSIFNLYDRYVFSPFFDGLAKNSKN